MTISDNKLPVHVQKMIKSIHDMETLIHTQKHQMITIDKEFQKFKKVAESFITFSKKQCEKKPRKPCGFELPVLISNDLCDFLDMPHGSKVARTEVTKYIIQYISDNQLTHPEKKTMVVPDEKLFKLLGDDTDLSGLTRFTMQKYMNRHFGAQ